MDTERRLEVGLFKIGKDAAGIGGFILGVEVRQAIGRVHEAVQPLAAARVGADGADGHLVFGFQPAQPDPGSVDDVGQHLGAAVEDHGVDGAADEVQERLGSGLGGGEGDDALRGEAGRGGSVAVRRSTDTS